jgi:hypothetical protein
VEDGKEVEWEELGMSRGGCMGLTRGEEDELEIRLKGVWLLAWYSSLSCIVGDLSLLMNVNMTFNDLRNRLTTLFFPMLCISSVFKTPK